MITIAKLNQKETKFYTDLYGDMSDKNILKEELEQARLIKTFLRELKKIEKKHGYTPHNLTVTGLIVEVGTSHYECIEEFIYCFKDDLKEGAQRYFETYY